MFYQLSTLLIPLLFLLRMYVHGYAWTSQLLWTNWIIVLSITGLLYILSKKNRYLTFAIATCSWLLISLSTQYLIVVALLLAIYVYHDKEWSYLVYVPLSIVQPYTAIVAAAVHTFYSKGRSVYTIALACVGFLYSVPLTLPNTQLTSTYIIVGILALTALLLKNLRTFTVVATILVVGILSKNPVLIYSAVLYTIAWYLQQLHNQKWSMPELKQICIMAIVTMILFSTINTSADILQSEPNKDTLDVLNLVNGTIIILPEHELAANITNADYIRASELIIPNSSNVEQLQRDGFLVDNIYVIPYTKIIVDTMKLNDATYILYNTENQRYRKGVYQALVSEEFILVHEKGTVQVYTYAI